MSEMLDRMCEAYWDSIQEKGATYTKWPALHGWVKETQRESMRQVLTAMRQPSESVLEVISEYHLGLGKAEECWQRVINAALEIKFDAG